MTPQQEARCHQIIHTAAASSAAANLIPIPGVGIAADLTAMTVMATALASIFSGSITKSVGEGLAVAALRETVLREPIRTISKELSKLVPFLGQIIAPAISVGMIESAGWNIARRLDEGKF